MHAKICLGILKIINYICNDATKQMKLDFRKIYGKDEIVSI